MCTCLNRLNEAVLTSTLNQYFENNLGKSQLKIVIFKAESRCIDVLSDESLSLFLSPALSLSLSLSLSLDIVPEI